MSAILTRVQAEISATLADPSPSRLLRVFISAFGVYASSLLLRLALARRAVLPLDRIEQMAEARYGHGSGDSSKPAAGERAARYPMRGRVAIVTGSTSGIGKMP